MRAVSFGSVFFADKENEHVITVLACKIRVTCSITENEQKTNTACKMKNLSKDRK